MHLIWGLCRKEKMKIKYLPELLLLMVAIIWGSSFIGIKIAINEGLGTLTILTIRFLIAAILMYIYMEIKNIKLDKNTFIKGSILGIVLFTALFFQTIGAKYTTASKNAFYTSMTVVFIPYITWLILKNKPHFNAIIATFLGFLGAISISLNIDKSFLYLSDGDIYSLLGAIFFALHLTLASKFTKETGVMQLTFYQLFIAFILSLLAALYTGDLESSHITMNGLASTIYVGVFSTFIGFTIQLNMQKILDTVKVSLILNLESIFAPIFAVIILGEILSFRIIIGFILSFLAVIISEIDFNKIKLKSIKEKNNV